MNILLMESYIEIKEEYLTYLKKIHNVLTLKDNFQKEDIEVIIVRTKTNVNKKLIDNFKNLKYVARIGVGINNIDTIYCKEKGIKVLNTPGANADSVSELVIAGILNLSRKLYLGFLGKENRFDYMGCEISSKIVGIFGFGNIGKKVYEKLKVFGVKQFYIYDPFLKKEDVEKNAFCNYVEDKNYICKNTNIISLHIPLLKQTKNFIGKEQIKSFSKDIILVNTSRGGIVDEKLLIDFLKDNEKAGYFADVWEEELEDKDPKEKLLQLDNTIITPHIGAMTYQAEERMHYFEDLNVII